MVARRLIDFVIAGLGLVILSPVLLGVALLVKVASGGPVLYAGDRVGLFGRAFRVHKFRTMNAAAAAQGPAITISGDSRITREGRWLRRYKLDELPQLVNVIKGDMSLVGPRPEDPRYVALYTVAQREVLKYRPGLTSLASLQFSREEELLGSSNWEQHYVDSVMPTKIQIEIAYAATRSIRSDMLILIRTALRLFGGNRPVDAETIRHA